MCLILSYALCIFLRIHKVFIRTFGHKVNFVTNFCQLDGITVAPPCHLVGEEVTQQSSPSVRPAARRRRQNYIVEQGHFAASPTTLIGEGGWRSQLYRFLGLLRSPPLVYVAYISPSLPGDRPYEWMWYKFCAACPTRPRCEMAARREKEAACQIDCREEGRRGGEWSLPGKSSFMQGM